MQRRRLTDSRYSKSAPPEAVRSLLGDLQALVGNDLADDAVAVCLDWTGAAD